MFRVSVLPLKLTWRAAAVKSSPSSINAGISMAFSRQSYGIGCRTLTSCNPRFKSPVQILLPNGMSKTGKSMYPAAFARCLSRVDLVGPYQIARPDPGACRQGNVGQISVAESDDGASWANKLFLLSIRCKNFDLTRIIYIIWFNSKTLIMETVQSILGSSKWVQASFITPWWSLYMFSIRFHNEMPLYFASD